MLGKTDEEQLMYAASEERAILTFNIRDFVRIGRSWLESGREHTGVIVVEPVSRRQFGVLLSRVLSLLNGTTAEEMRNQIRYL